MNSLARVVHDLVAGEEVVCLFDLSPLEQATLVDLQPLLRLSPQDLAAFLAQEPEPEDWISPPPLACVKIRS